VVQPPLVQLDYDNAVRVVPALLDPHTQFDEIVAQYRGLSERAQPTGWYGGTVSGAINFQIGLRLPAGSPARVVLGFPIRVTISRTEDAADEMDILRPTYAGGGGVFNTFPEFALKPGQFDALPSAISAAELASGAATEVGYGFSAACSEPGVFQADFLFPYEVHEGSRLRSQLVPFSVVLACPQVATVWAFDPETGALDGTTTLVLRDGRYTPQP